MAIARYFDSAKDDGSMFGGVPKRDLTDEEWDALPDWLKASVDNSPMYRKTRPATTAPDKPKEGD